MKDRTLFVVNPTGATQLRNLNIADDPCMYTSTEWSIEPLKGGSVIIQARREDGELSGPLLVPVAGFKSVDISIEAGCIVVKTRAKGLFTKEYELVRIPHSILVELPQCMGLNANGLNLGTVDKTFLYEYLAQWDNEGSTEVDVHFFSVVFLDANKDTLSRIKRALGYFLNVLSSPSEEEVEATLQWVVDQCDGYRMLYDKSVYEISGSMPEGVA